nr:hypothetical protein [Treponema vincentii]
MIYAPIEDTALQQHLDKLEKDELHIFTADDGLFRGGLFHGTRFVNRIRAQHRRNPRNPCPRAGRPLCRTDDSNDERTRNAPTAL